MLRIKLIKSPIGHTRKNRLTVAALGLRKVSQVVEHNDNPAIRGMIHKVKHLLSVEEIGGEKAMATGGKKSELRDQSAEKKVVKTGKAGTGGKATKPAKASKSVAEKAVDITPDEPVEEGAEDQPPAAEPVAAGEEK